MAREGGFFSGSASRDKRIAGGFSGYSTEDKKNVINYQKKKAADPTYKPKSYELESLKRQTMPGKGLAFSPGGNEIGQIASATTDLSGLMASKLPSDYKETESQVNFENMLRKNFGDDADTMDYGIKQFIKQDFQRPDGTFDSPVRFQDNLINKALTDTKIAAADFDKEGYNNFLKKDFGIDSESGVYKSFPNNIKMDLRQQFKEKNNLKFKDSSFAPTDTKVAMMQGDNLGGPAALLGGVLTIGGMGVNAVKNMYQNFAPKLRENMEKKLNPEDNRVSIGDRVGGFLNSVMGISPVAAGTLDANQQVSQVSERPKLNYVNPDAKTMTISEIKESLKPSNLFGYKDKFGRFDDPGSPLARDRAETMQRVAQNFTSPIVGDARTIGQIRADQEARMRENARLRNESFQRGERVQQKSADVTYGTNMLSNPAFGFRDKMTDAAKAQYDKSAKDATEMARTDPSLGNVVTQTFNRVSGFFGGPQASLEKIGERQLRLANKEINKPRYQKEAYARKMLGITNDQLKARNLQQIRANAAARNQAFQSDRRAKAVERAARRYGQNTGSGRKGGFGSGTVGKGMSSNPAGMRQQGVGVSANNLSRHKAGRSTGTSTGTSTSSSSPSTSSTPSTGGINRSQSRRRGSSGGKKGGGGGGGTGGGGGGSSSSGTKGGAGRKASKASKSRTGRGRSQCDIRTKIDITSLTNQNLMKDDLATVAYFVQELRGE